MARPDPFDGLSEVLMIVRKGSFRAAALELGVTPGAVSQAVKTLEHRLGLPLFNRTTRKTSLTEAGEKLLAQLAPAIDAINGTLEELAQLRSKPSGTLRLLVERVALAPVIEPILPAFHLVSPEVKIEITVSNVHTDFITGGYDAGIRIGDYIDQDMLAVRVSRPFTWMVFGSPDYFRTHGRPLVPEDIQNHKCIRYRRPEKGDIYRWEFVRNGQHLRIEPKGDIQVNDGALMKALAVRGMALTYSSTLHAAAEVAAGTLEPVLESFAPPQDSLFIYFPKSNRNQPKLRAFIEACAPLVR